MPILIEHPKHGKMHVYSPDELKKHESWGWFVVKPKEITHVVQEETTEEVVEIKKRGRPRKE